MILSFDLIPYVGAGPLRFGMTSIEVISFLGKPLLSRETRSGRRNERWETIAVLYGSRSSVLDEMEFYASADVYFQNINIFRDQTKAFRALLLADGEPFESLGTIVLMNLGITISLPEEETKTLTLFEKGKWDPFKSNLKRMSVPHLLENI